MSYTLAEDTQTDRHNQIQTDRQTDRQAHTHTHTTLAYNITLMKTKLKDPQAIKPILLAVVSTINTKHKLLASRVPANIVFLVLKKATGA